VQRGQKIEKQRGERSGSLVLVKKRKGFKKKGTYRMGRRVLVNGTTKN